MPKEYRTLYGSKSPNTCAFCYKKKLSLTPKQMRQKQCLKKDCHYLVKVPHRIWEEREATKAVRKARKEKLEAMYKEVTNG